MNTLKYAVAVLRYAIRLNRMWYAYIAATILSIVFELAAILTLMPLASLASQGTVSNGRSTRLLQALGLPITGTSLLLLFLALFSLRLVTLFGTQAMSVSLSRRLMADLATRSFANLTHVVPMQDVEKTTIGSYIALVGDESFRASMVVSNISALFSQFALTALYYVALFLYSPTAGIALACFLALTVLALAGSFRYSQRLGDLQSAQSRQAGSIFLDALNGLRSVRAFRAESYVTGTYRERMRDYVGTLIRLDLVAQAGKLGPAALLLVLLIVALLIPGFGRVFLKDFAFLVTLILMMMRLFPVLGQMLIALMKIFSDLRVGRDVTYLARDLAEHDRDGLKLAGPIRSLSFDRAGFGYTEVPVFEELSVRFEAGKSYAIVGPSGIGKSTLFDLILKFYAPQTGVISANQSRLDEIATANLREKVLLVTQDVTIFNDTVANNIAFGTAATLDEIKRASRIACVDDFIESLDQGFRTELTYRGTNLSGGQKQRIGIARAILRRPDVLLLDECTSALDPETRKAVVGNLLKEFSDQILIFVTHDEWLAEQVDITIDFMSLKARQ